MLTLDAILQPVTADQFLKDYFGKAFLYSVGQPGKFVGLLSWVELNAILRRHRLDFPRLRLVKNGESIPSRTFNDYTPTKTPRLRPVDLTGHLADGATLIVDAVDEIHEPITGLAENLERTLKNRIQVNMYAGWRSSQGFNLHWDKHDVLVLQVAGSKQWKVYRPTRAHPLSKDSEGGQPPLDPPVWAGILKDGGLLYIPRGWWHVATSLDEPTLHLTIGLHNANGVDLLQWFVDRLRSNAGIRQDLPRFASRADRATHLEKIKCAWTDAWSDALIDEYFDSNDGRAQSRPALSLPWTATPEVLPPEAGSYCLKWLPTRAVTSGSGSIEIACHGKKWTFAPSAGPILSTLQQRGTCSLEDLQASTAGDPGKEVVRRFAAELVKAGLVAIVDRDR